MSEMNPQREAPTVHEAPASHAPSPLTMPPARLRERTADDAEIDVTDPRIDVPLDDSDRLREDAETLRD